MRNSRWLSVFVVCALSATLARGDTLADIQARGTLIWGADAEGGGPYVYPDPEQPRSMIGFEAELADALAGELGVRAEFFQGPWHNLPAVLATGQIDIVLNGYELTPSRAARMEHTRPYYVYELALLARRDNDALTAWDDLDQPAPGDRKFKIGVLQASAAQFYLEERFADTVEVVVYEGTTDSMREVETGKLDATLTDQPAAVFYRDRFAALHQVGRPVARGYYVILMRQGDETLRDALNEAIDRLLADGKLEAIYQRYGLWNEAQLELVNLGATDEELGIRAEKLGGWAVIRSRGGLLVEAAGVTIVLACLSMPLAMLLGLGVALARMFGPWPLRWLAIGYIELLRGTPLLLQLYTVFFLLPEVGIRIPAFYAAVAGLAINYSAYEAEIYRAGLQAVPRGQMEAALALGMSHALALRRVIIPQAVRIVVPPVTNDFINMFKDTSICSVITVMELTKQYTVQQNNTGATLELAALTALLYLAMSIPLARLASYLEKRLTPKPRGPAA
ncbi:MAG: ABC transporter permease subunit [Planctomycetota bacterium]|nr:MAG: ABC transporter permease subunit [Planctomycetota bacterium]